MNKPKQIGTCLSLLFLLGVSPIHAQFKIEDFSEIVGIKKGDNIDKITEKFGQPSSTSDMDMLGFHYYDYNGTTVFWAAYDRESGMVTGMEFDANTSGDNSHFWKFMQRKGIKDPKLSLLKMKPDRLKKMFGEPTSVNSGTWHFENENILLTFYCYDFWGSTCMDFNVHWKME